MLVKRIHMYLYIHFLMFTAYSYCRYQKKTTFHELPSLNYVPMMQLQSMSHSLFVPKAQLKKRDEMKNKNKKKKKKELLRNLLRREKKKKHREDAELFYL